MLVVLALVVLISVFALPALSNRFKLSLESSARELAYTLKETYNTTAVTRLVHRVVYDLKDNSYWVEVGPATFLLETEESKEKEERRKKFKTEAELAKKKGPPAFTLDRTVTRKKVTLPSGVTFEDVLTEAQKEPITEGAAYTHFFPQGFAEQTVIHLKDTDNHRLSLIVASVVGNSRMVHSYVSREDAFGKSK